jgi:hypothetical protein
MVRVYLQNRGIGAILCPFSKVSESMMASLHSSLQLSVFLLLAVMSCSCICTCTTQLQRLFTSQNCVVANPAFQCLAGLEMYQSFSCGLFSGMMVEVLMQKYYIAADMHSLVPWEWSRLLLVHW